MQITLRKLKQLILNEISGPLRQVRGSKTQQYKIGKVQDENQELSTSEAESLFPGSTDAWAEIVPALFPDYPFDDPIAIKKHSVWFRIGQMLTVAFEEQPQIELASWDPIREDWIENDFNVAATG